MPPGPERGEQAGRAQIGSDHLGDLAADGSPGMAGTAMAIADLTLPPTSSRRGSWVLGDGGSSKASRRLGEDQTHGTRYFMLMLDQPPSGVW